MRYQSTFPWIIPLLWAGYSRVTRPSATFLSKTHPERIVSKILVRLACVRHAASVRPEPGSNSRLNGYINTKVFIYSFVCQLILLTDISFVINYPNFCHKKLNSLFNKNLHYLSFNVHAVEIHAYFCFLRNKNFFI